MLGVGGGRPVDVRNLDAPRRASTDVVNVSRDAVGSLDGAAGVPRLAALRVVGARRRIRLTPKTRLAPTAQATPSNA
jgi:hypothetical protein